MFAGNYAAFWVFRFDTDNVDLYAAAMTVTGLTTHSTTLLAWELKIDLHFVEFF